MEETTPPTFEATPVPPSEIRPAPFPVFRELALLAGVLVSVFFLPYLYSQAKAPIADATANMRAPQATTLRVPESAPSIPDASVFEHIAQGCCLWCTHIC